MASPVLVAFLVDVIASTMSQVGLVFQKLAHRKQESQQKRIQKAPPAQTESNEGKPGIDTDENAGKAYCSWQFVLGFIFMASGSGVHVACLPFLDLTLVAVNASLGIVIAVALSVAVFGETFIWKYDAAGLAFICAGCTTVVLTANTIEQEFTGEQVVDLLLSVRSLVFSAICTLTLIVNSFMLKRFLKKLRLFESDVEEYQSTSRSRRYSQDSCDPSSMAGYQEILPPQDFLQKVPSYASLAAESKQALLTEELLEMQRPARKLIEAITDIPLDLIMKVSPNSANLKRFIKVPMIILVTCAAMLSGTSVVMIKLIGELIQSEDAKNNVGLMVMLFVLLILSASYNLHLVNVAMKYYDQMIVVPVYQTCLMIMWITSGLVLLNESKFYSWGEIIKVDVGVGLCIIGILFLTQKTKALRAETQKEYVTNLEIQIRDDSDLLMIKTPRPRSSSQKQFTPINELSDSFEKQI